jgi:hypothetical protein
MATALGVLMARAGLGAPASEATEPAPEPAGEPEPADGA